MTRPRAARPGPHIPAADTPTCDVARTLVRVLPTATTTHRPPPSPPPPTLPPPTTSTTGPTPGVLQEAQQQVQHVTALAPLQLLPRVIQRLQHGVNVSQPQPQPLWLLLLALVRAVMPARQQPVSPPTHQPAYEAVRPAAAGAAAAAAAAAALAVAARG